MRLLAALAGTLAAAIASAEPTVLLVSLDGTRADVVETTELPTLRALAALGARGRLVPVFPSNTFPAHVTLVTGVEPEVHGVVNNVFVDPQRGLHRYDDDPTWSDAEPLWSLLAGHGIPSASFHWVGSEGAWRSGRGPRHWRRFDASLPEERKVDQVLAWLDLADPAERPRFVTVYFRGEDGAAHRHGPGSAAGARDLARQDRALARLVDGIAARELWSETTLIVLSDHGMLPVERRVDLARALPDARVLGGGGFAIVLAPPGATPEALERLAAAARALGVEAWPRTAAPPDLPVRHPRFGDVVVLAPPGTVLNRARGRGAHGHRHGPGTPGLEALFVAYGRRVPEGATLGALRARDVAPTILGLLGVPVPESMQGRIIEAFQP